MNRGSVWGKSTKSAGNLISLMSGADSGWRFFPACAPGWRRLRMGVATRVQRMSWLPAGARTDDILSGCGGLPWTAAAMPKTTRDHRAGSLASFASYRW
jgi:hypothetical protein